MMIDHTTVQRIEEAIDELAVEFRRTPGLLLTEDDLKCHLMAKFLRIEDLGVRVESADTGVHAIAVHSEIPWFDDQDHLRLRPDLTITDPGALSIRRAMQQGIPLPRKGFHFIGPSVVLELKLYRGLRGIRPAALGPIRKDIQKIETLVGRGRRLSPETFLRGIVVVFARYSGVCREVNELAAQRRENVRVIVHSADFRG